MGKTRLLPKNDLVFQRIFGKIGNENIAKRFIELIIEEKIETIDLDVNKELIRDKEEEKLGRLDVRAKLNGGISCNIEIQLKDQNNMEKRTLYYWAKLHSGQLKQGENYNNTKRTISIIIMGENLNKLKKVSSYHTKWKLREEEQKDLILTEDIEIHILELGKLKEIINKKDELRLWLLFLENPENEEVQKEMEENIFLQQAMKEYEHLRGSEGFWRIVELREKNLRDESWEKENAREAGLAEGRAEGLKQGKEEGIKEGIKEGRKEGIKEGLKEGVKEGVNKTKKDIAKKLLKEDFTIDDIVRITELTHKEIEEIEKEAK